MVKLHINKLTTGQTVCIVHHDWGRGVWTETVTGDLREGKEYARFQVEPDIEVQLRYVGGEMIAETRTPHATYIIKPTPPPWQYQRG